MDFFGLISFIQKIVGYVFSDTIIVVKIHEVKLGNYLVEILNDGNKNIEILSIHSNEKDVNQLSSWEKFPLPFHLLKKNSISRKFYLTKDNHYEKPKEIEIKYKLGLRRKSKKIIV